MNRRSRLRANGTQLIDRLADHVHDATEDFGSDGNCDGLSGVLHSLTAGQAVGGVHRDAANGVLTQVLRNLNNKVVFLVVDERVAQRQR